MTVFLDLDGCLVDSREAIGLCLERAFAGLGLAVPSRAELVPLIGPPFAVSLPGFLADRDHDPGLVEDVIDAYRLHYTVESLRLTVVWPGIPEALAALVDAGHALVLCTSKPHPTCADVVRAVGLLPLLDGVFGPPDFARAAEPKTETLARALAAHPGPGVMVGDRKHDLLAGTANGLPTIGVTWGIGDLAELTSAGATALVDSPAGLPAAVAALGLGRAARAGEG